MYCATNQFHDLNFIGIHNKPHGVRGLGKNYHMRFDTKLGHGTYAIRCIPCDCTYCTSIHDQSWNKGLPEQKQPFYKPVKDCTYWTVLGSFNKYNILKLSHKATSSEEFEKIHQIVIDGISENMDSLLQTSVPLIQQIQPQRATF